ncbi:hypothetical protein D3C87_1817820 [compost metagenome]
MLIGRLHRVADIGHLEALGHDDADLDAVFTVETEFARIGIFETGADRGDIAKSGDLAAGAKPQVLQVLHLVKTAFDRDAHRARAGIDRAGRVDVVLAGNRAAQVVERQPALGQRIG